MPTLTITAAVQISDAEEAQLLDVLGCPVGQLQAEVQKYAGAAIREYIDMFVGAGAITTATDLRERRLVGLMTSVFNTAPPGADLVARLFNMTPSGARSLMRAVAGKHRLRVKETLDRALKATLDACQRPDAAKPYSAVILNPILVELLNARLAASDQPRTPVRLAGDSLTKYTIDSGSFDYLRPLFP